MYNLFICFLILLYTQIDDFIVEEYKSCHNLCLITVRNLSKSQFAKLKYGNLI